MNCPNCSGKELRPVLTKKGAEVDYCDSCHGVWLDRGEIFQFAQNPKLVAAKLNKGVKEKKPVTKKSPRTGKDMFEFPYPGGPHIDFCPDSGGLWFDAGELKSLLEVERTLQVDLDKQVVAHGKQTTKGPVRAKLLPLPNLFLRSTITLTGLYALMGAIIIIAAEFMGIGVGIALLLAVAVILLQFIFGPFLMDLSLRFFYRVEWLDEEASRLSDDMFHFIRDLCKEKNMKFPRIGILDDGAPQAFTYGHIPDNARVVISKGILELLSPEEAKAVVAHEIGHAIHWDMFLMTVAQLVPLVLYYIYRSLLRVRSKGGKDRDAGVKVFIAVSAFILYVVTEYIVLWFSRTREYHADRFAGEVTKEPSHLASALVKIAYGLAGQKKDGIKVEKERNNNLEAIGALGIFDRRAATALAISAYNEKDAATGGVSPENIKGAMRWDIWNPWAKWYELNSTHPLVANRLRYLSDQATHMGKDPYIVFNEVQPESYWDEFFVDLLIHVLPVLSIIIPLGIYGTLKFMNVQGFDDRYFFAGMLVLVGIALFVRYRFIYRGDFFPKMSVAALLKRVKVSSVRPIPCTVKGKVIGRGVPGYIFSEDFVMKDDTGIIFLDYRQPLAIWEFLFGLLKAGKYNGQEVSVEGWYRRAPVPFVEINRLNWKGTVKRSWVPFMNRLTAILFIVGGFGWLVMIIAQKFMH